MFGSLSIHGTELSEEHRQSNTRTSTEIDVFDGNLISDSVHGSQYNLIYFWTKTEIHNRSSSSAVVRCTSSSVMSFVLSEDLDKTSIDEENLKDVKATVGDWLECLSCIDLK